MSFRMIWKYAAGRILNRLLFFFLTLVLCVCTFAVALFYVFYDQYMKRGRMECDAYLTGGVERTGIIEFYSDTFDDNGRSEKFLAEVHGLAGIEGIGDAIADTTDRDVFPDIWALQQKLEGKGNTSPGMLGIGIEGCTVCRLELSEGRLPSEYQVDEHTSLLYLGHALADIPVGTTYHAKFGTEDYTFIVAGILMPGAKWLSEDVCLESGLIDTNYSENLDYSAIKFRTGHASFRLMFSVGEGCSVEELKPAIQDIADQWQLEIGYFSLSELLNQRERDQKNILKPVYKLMLMLMVTVAVLLFCVQMIDILSDTRYFGILYANGASTRDIIMILLGENIGKVFLGYGIAAAAVFQVLKNFFYTFFGTAAKWQEVSKLIYT
ncbi:MAG: hypothetical protein K2G89_04455, partial [Lachnospiraceae bacterium]|nr:hypothetical protein [Lachnospiraceae bacterium]